MNSQNNRCIGQSPAAVHTLAIRPGLRRWLIAGFDRLYDWFERSQSRRQLAALDDRLLRDIGIDRVDADNELRKPFWQA